MKFKAKPVDWKINNDKNYYIEGYFIKSGLDFI